MLHDRNIFNYTWLILEYLPVCICTYLYCTCKDQKRMTSMNCGIRSIHTYMYVYKGDELLWHTHIHMYIYRDGTVEINPGNLINARFEKAGTGCRNALCYCKGLVSLGKWTSAYSHTIRCAFPTRFSLKLIQPIQLHTYISSTSNSSCLNLQLALVLIESLHSVLAFGIFYFIHI